MQSRPNILVILTDQQRFPPPYESDETRQFRSEKCSGEESIRKDGISFNRHYVMSAACAPSRASLLTGHYPSLHGVTQTDGLSKSEECDDMFWLDPDTVPTMGDWFRAGGYRTFFKGKWHVSHAHIDAADGSGPLQSLNSKGAAIEQSVSKYLDADLLDDFGFSEWVGPEPHGLGKQNTGTMKDPFTADETIDLFERFDADDSDEPWLTVCSLLNPHDCAIFGLVGPLQGLRYKPWTVPSIAHSPTFREDLSSKPTCQQSYNDVWKTMFSRQPFNVIHRKFYYQMQAEVDVQIARVLDALRASKEYENTIVVFTSDHGDTLGAHGGMHQKWHNAYDETTRVPFIVSSPLLPDGSREIDTPTNHADLIPTLLGLAGIDPAEALAKLQADHSEAQPLVGRDLSRSILGEDADVKPEPVLFVTDDEISEGSARSPSPVQRIARRLRTYSTVVQPNHIQTVVAEVAVDGEPHLVKFSRYYDNQQFWTVPGERDERLRGRKTLKFTQPEPDEYELYDLTLDPLEERNLAHPSKPNERSRALQKQMLALLIEQLDAKRLTPSVGEIPGYRPPAAV
ncbi:MAG: sulfatase-like hydrolase/transferase [Thermoleophilaceae bacterium]|nr:sulfatase-like hydrolase/transferase [Thermoleophilaceae bacterium]